MTLYRTLETAHKGANLVIFCILSEIDNFRQRNNGRYPDEIYLQVDGGAENANK